MTDTTFKVGDRVRSVRTLGFPNFPATIAEGTEHVIERAESGWYGHTYLHFGGNNGGWDSRRFDLVETAELQKVKADDEKRVIDLAKRAFGDDGWLDELQKSAEDTLYARLKRAEIEGVLKQLDDGLDWKQIAGQLRGIAGVITRDLEAAS